MAILKQYSTELAPFHLHFLIIGGGICGFSAAIALRREGHQVTVIEKDKTLDEGTNEGCRIPPNLYKILCEWGLEAELQKISSRLETTNVLSYQTGAYLGGIQWDQEVLDETRGELRLTSYSALRALLCHKALSEGTCVRFGARAISIDSACPSVTLDGGDIIRANVVVGADGVDGLARRCISGTQPREEEEGGEVLKAFSTSIPKRYLLSDPKLAYLNHRRENDMLIWIGHDYSALGFASGNDFFLCVYGFNSSAEDLRYTLRGADPSLRRFCSVTSLACTSLKHEHVLDNWVKEKLVVIGDAAHPLPPSSGQRCALSVEDGAVLGKLFSITGSRSSPLLPYIPTLLAAFHSIRYSRCASIQTKELGLVHYMTMPGVSNAEPDVREQGIWAKRDEAGIIVVPVKTGMPEYYASSFSEEDTDSEFEEESAFSWLVHWDSESTGERGVSPEWVEIVETFGYEAKEEAEEWWATWGRFRNPGVWNGEWGVMVDDEGAAIMGSLGLEISRSSSSLVSNMSFSSSYQSSYPYSLVINPSFSSDSFSSISSNSLSDHDSELLTEFDWHYATTAMSSGFQHGGCCLLI